MGVRGGWEVMVMTMAADTNCYYMLPKARTLEGDYVLLPEELHELASSHR